MQRIIRLPTPDNVANSSRFTVKLPVGPTYAAAHLVLGGTFTAANISNLEFSINGRPIQRFKSGTHLNKYNKRNGRPDSDTNNVLSIWFRRSELEETEDAELFDIGTARPDPNNADDKYSPVVETLTITGDVSGATSPTMTAFATTSSKIRPLRMMTKIMYFPKTFTVSTGGTEGDFDAFPIGQPNAVLLGAHLAETVDNTVTAVRLTANIAGSTVELIENGSAALLKHLDEGSAKPKTWQAAFVHLDMLTGSGQAMDGVPLATVGDLRARITCLHASNTTEELTIYADMADTFQGI